MYDPTVTSEPSPSSLEDLIHWYRSMWEAEVPLRLHMRESDPGGIPEWTAAFRHWLDAHPRATDREGYVRSPIRFWLHVLASQGRRGAKRARYLWLLAYFGCDWFEATQIIYPLADHDLANAYTKETLRRFHRLCQNEPRVFIRPRGKGA